MTSIKEKTMIKKVAAQGDVLFVRVETIPETAKASEDHGETVVAHSETGHHHIARADGLLRWDEPKNPLVCYLRSEVPIALDHQRAWDTHEQIVFEPGTWRVINQREYSKSVGWRRARD